MKRLLLLFPALFSYAFVFGQCSVNTSATQYTITCGQSATLSAFGQSSGTVMLNENFNSGSFGAGWSGTPGAVNFSNPCSPGGVDGTPHAWMDNNTAVPRALISSPYNLSSATAGVTICFDMLFAEQGDAAPCEGPDEPDEGIYLQYSTNGGATWTDIHYFDPNGGNDPQFVNWNNWCFAIPAAAITSNTMFQWFQDADSGADFDHWGIDNVQIYQNDVNGQLVWLHDGYSYGVGNPGGPNPTPVAPTTTTTYTAQLTTGAGVVCTETVTINVIAPVYSVTASASPTTLCPGDCATITATAQQEISPHTTPTFENNEFEVVTGGDASVNINVQGLNTTSIANGTITQVVINGFNFSGTQLCFSPPPPFGTGTCPCNGATVPNGQQCNLNTSGFSVTLTAPGGCDIILVPAGSATGGYSNTTFVPVGGSAFGGTFPNGGTWAPNQPMSGLNGCNPNGVWTLTFDGPGGFAFGAGSLTGWSISFDDPAILGPVTYTWSPTTAMTGSTTLTPTVCPAASTTYSLTVSTPNPACPTHVQTVPITVTPCAACVPPAFTVTPPAAICAPATLNLASTVSGTGANIVTYHATNADATGDVNPLPSSTVSASGTYFIRVETPADPLCFTVQSVTVTVNPIVTVSVNPPAATICPGASVNLTASGATTYTWANAAGLSGTTGSTVTATPAATTTYTVTGTSGTCTGDTTVTVTISNNLVVNVSPSSTVCPNTPVNLTASGATTYTWSPGTDLDVTSGPNVVSTPGSTITYTVTGATGGCTGDTTVTITVSNNLVVNVSPSSTVCPNTPVNLTASGATTYTWSPATDLSATTGANVTSTPAATITYTVSGATGGCTGDTTVTITVSNNLVVDVTPPAPTICPGGSVLLTASGATTYTWSPGTGLSGTTTNTVTASPATTTTYTVSGANGGCTGDTTVTVTVATALVISVTPPNATTCPNTPVILTASGATTYTWSPGTDLSATTGATVTSTPAATITYTVTGTQGTCTGDTTVTVNVANNLVVSVTPSSATTCPNTPVNLTASGATTYTWTPATNLSATTGPNVTSTPPATITYTVNGATGGCTGDTTVTITVANNLSVITNTPTPICVGGSAAINASGAATYTWTPATGLSSTSGANVTASPTVTTTYTVNGAQSGCTGDTTVTVTVQAAPTLTITAVDPTVCVGANTTLTASGGSNYTWAPPATLSSSSGTSVIATPVANTTYTVTGQTATCPGTGTITIAVTTAPVITLTPVSATICAGETIQINASGAATYQPWGSTPAGGTITPLNPDNSSMNVSPQFTTVYTVLPINSCPQPATVTITVLPTIIADAGINDTICLGEHANLVATGGNTFAWLPVAGLSNPNLAFSSAAPFATTVYTVTTSYTGGLCPATDMVTIVVNPPPVVYAGMDTTIDVEDEAILFGYSNSPDFIWTEFSTTTLNCYNCLTPVATPTNTTTYILTAANEFGCLNSDTVTIFVSQEYGLYIPTAFSPNGDHVNEGWQPKGFGIKKITIYVFDRWGLKLFEAKDLETAWDGRYKGHGVQEDVYIFKVTAETYSDEKINKVGHVTLVR
ncbi:MAG: domain containing protein [Bacteroidetes bacterium]|jgi:gliding motility-associated-like protein|nr:domain containing protein [Bacteroidota bacterium]